MRIAVFEAEAWERDSLGPLTGQHEISVEACPLDGQALERLGEGPWREADVLSTFIHSELGAEVLEQLPNLRLIATRSTGVDHIDTEYCERKGIRIANVPTYGENTVAEHVFALLLAISHRIVEATDRTRKGDFSQQGLRGFDLQGRTLGIVGMGNIGQHVARIARGFGMPVLAFDLEPDQALAEALGCRYVELPELLRESDVVTLHVPGGKSTRHMMSDDEFGAMKDGAVLINTARGDVVDNRALLHALSTGRLAAVGLDVLAEEPLVREEAELLRIAYSREHDLEALLADHILLRLRNVIITPHNAFNTREAVQRILDTTRENIEAFARGEPRNLVL